MLTDGHHTYCEHFLNVKLLCCTPESNIMYVNYNFFKKVNPSYIVIQDLSNTQNSILLH